MYLAPFIILFTGWSINEMTSFKPNAKWQRLSKVFGYMILTVILIGNLIAANIYLRTTNQNKAINQVINILEKKYPGSKFSIYDHLGRSSFQSQSLSLVLKMKNRTDPNGRPIGLACKSEPCRQKLPWITSLEGENVIDLTGIKEKDLRKPEWIKVNQENMYDDLIGWSKKNELKSSFSLTKYIMERLPEYSLFEKQ